MAIRLFHLKPLSPFHLGEATGAMERVSEVIHSDTLFSGLCHAWLRLYGRKSLESFLRALKDDGGLLKLSSAFPYRKNESGEIAYYLPWPLGSASIFQFEDHKVVKRIPFIPVEFFEKFFTNGIAEAFSGKTYPRIQIPRADEKLLIEEAKKLKEGIWIETRISTALCRRSMSAVPYYVSVLRFKTERKTQGSEWGLYILAEGNEAWIEKLPGALRLLGDMGVGGERSIGCGVFEIEHGDFTRLEKLIDRQADYYMSISLVFPAREEREKLERSRINFLERKGWIESPEMPFAFRKKRILMIKEGSVLAYPVKGSLIDVSPDGWPGHKVYRYGVGFYLPVTF